LAGFAEHPREYRWSSYGANGQGQNSEVIKEHYIYLQLGKSPDERQAIYYGMFDQGVTPDFVDGLRRATNGNYPLGDEYFRYGIEKLLGRKMTPRKRGRPSKHSTF